MAIKLIKPTDELPERNVVVVIYAQPGTSKTSLSFTAENPLLLDFDRGIERCVGRKDAIKVDKWDDVIELQQKKFITDNGYKTVIIDTAGTCLDNYIAEYCILQEGKNKKKGGGLSLAGYGAMKDVFTSFVRSLKDVDIIMICHAQEKETAGDKQIVRPKMTGGAYDVVMSVADMVGYMDIQDDKRILNFNPTENSVGKNSAELKRIELPHYESKEWPNLMSNIIQKVKDKMKAETQEQEQAAKIVEGLKIQIGELQDPDDFDAFSGVVAEQPEIYKAQMRKLVANRAAELGIMYDTTDKTWKKKPADKPGEEPATTTPKKTTNSKKAQGKESQETLKMGE